MNVYYRFPQRRNQFRVITVGVFDGVHLGHAKLLKRLITTARQQHFRAAVITFDDHPHGTLAPAERPPRLATPAQCLERMAFLGVDEVFLISFTPQLAALTADTFVRTILVAKLGVKHIVVGKDFVFGKNGQGNIHLLRKMGKVLGFEVTVVSPLRRDRQVVSSSTLRQLIARGAVAQAARWLGWAYTLHGVVERGEGRGSQLGIPTANLRTTHEVVPSPGTYAVLAVIQGQIWPALCHIGKRPTFHRWGPETIETYIPGWKGRLYGERLEVQFLGKLRREKRFHGAAALVQQVIKDWADAMSFWPAGITLRHKDLHGLINHDQKHHGNL